MEFGTGRFPAERRAAMERHLRARPQRGPGRKGDPGPKVPGGPCDEVRAAARGGRELEGGQREAYVRAVRLRGEPEAPGGGRHRPVLPAPGGPGYADRGDRGRDGGARPGRGGPG